MNNIKTKNQIIDIVEKELENYNKNSEYTDMLIGKLKKEIVYQITLSVFNSELMIKDDPEKIEKNVKLFLNDYDKKPNKELKEDVEKIINKWVEIIRFENN